MDTFDIGIDLIFGVLDKAINAGINVHENQVAEASKHSDDLTVKSDKNKAHSSSTTRVNVKRVHVSTNHQVEGEHLNSTSHNS